MNSMNLVTSSDDDDDDDDEMCLAQLLPSGEVLICHTFLRSVVCLSVCLSSVTFVHPA